MTHDTTPREDARDLQAKLYREIGISAVAAALRFTTQPDPVPVAEARRAKAERTELAPAQPATKVAGRIARAA